MNNNLFYLRDTRSDVGANATFWNEAGGYGSDLDKLEVCTLEKAQSRYDSRETDVPLLKSLVDSLAVIRVDMQYLKSSMVNSKDANDEYLIVRDGDYLGNDICFLTGVSLWCYDLSGAKKYNASDINEVTRSISGISVYSYSDILAISRKTFRAEDFNRLTMCTKAGIKLKRKKYSRPTLGKTRGNCPVCGKITWDYNPYENAYCSDHSFQDTWEYKHGFVGRGSVFA